MNMFFYIFVKGLNKEIFTSRGIRLSGDTAVCLVEQIDYRSVRCVSEDPWKSVGVCFLFLFLLLLAVSVCGVVLGEWSEKWSVVCMVWRVWENIYIWCGVCVVYMMMKWCVWCIYVHTHIYNLYIIYIYIIYVSENIYITRVLLYDISYVCVCVFGRIIK